MKNMTYKQAVDSLMESCRQFLSAIEILQEENAFLTDTIVKYNIGEIVQERRKTEKYCVQWRAGRPVMG